jgi:diguanylate cyclase (GGDEF)-like protein
MPGHALDPARPLHEYVRVNWSVENGLPQSTVRAVVQTADGYLWLATHEGLTRFDGRQFRVYNEGNAPHLRGTGVSALLPATDGGLWIGLRDGGVVKLTRTGDFSALDVADGIPRGTVMLMREDGKGGLWVATSGAGVGYVSPRGNPGSKIFTTENGLPHNSVQAIEVVDGALYVGTARGMTRIANLVVEDDDITARYARASIGAIHRDRDNRFWVGVTREGLAMRESKASPWRTWGKRDGIPDQLTRVLVDRDGLVWVGTLEGLYAIALSMPRDVSAAAANRAGTVRAMTVKNGLTSNYVRDVMEDAEGNLWVGTEGGLDRLRDGAISMWDATRGLTEEFARTVMEARDGTIWVGTSNGLFRMKDGTFTRYSARDGLVSDAVLSLAEDRDGTLWVGTNAGGVHALRGPGGGRFVNEGPKWGTEAAPIRAILFAKNGDIWIGTATGLIRVDAATGKAISIGGRGTTATDQMLSIMEDASGRIWLGTRAGLLVFENNQLSDIWKKRGADSAIFSMLPDRDRIWIASGRGLLSIAGDKLLRVGNEQGMPARAYFKLLEGAGDTLWACGNSGMVKLNKSALTAVVEGGASQVVPRFFDRGDGMGSTQCNGGSQPAGWSTRDGRVLFPTARGVAVFDASRALRRNPRPPPVHITSVAVEGEPMSTWENITLPPGSRRIEIGFVGLSYVDADRVRYRYRMEGFDQDWIERPARATLERATYTNLPPGRYRFQVIAANNDGVWNEEGAVIPIEKRPLLIETWWLRLGLLLLLLVALGFAYRLRVRALARQSHRLQSLVEARTQELADAMGKLDHMAHADGLTGIANRRRLDEYLAGTWAANSAQQRPLAVLLIDVDHFKRYNDERGHLEGDELLKKLAGILQNCLRRSEDLVARYGGEEFMVVLPGADTDIARSLGESMRAAVEWGMPGVTISVGVASARGQRGSDPASVVAAADAALYRAKDLGRNRVEVA